MSQEFRAESRRNWVCDGTTPPLNEQLAFGCLQRIADATELMAKRWGDVLAERDRYKQNAEYRATRIDALKRSNAALRGVITRLKKAKP